MNMIPNKYQQMCYFFSVTFHPVTFFPNTTHHMIYSFIYVIYRVMRALEESSYTLPMKYNILYKTRVRVITYI